MERSQQLLARYGHKYSEYTKERVAQKETEKGRMKELCTLRAFRERFPDSESVFQEIYNARTLKVNNRCKCGALVSKYRKTGTYKYTCPHCPVGQNIISPLKGTPLERPHIPLNEILEFAFMMYQGKNFTGAEGKRLFGRCDETAFNTLYRVRNWMALAVSLYEFDPTRPVQIDEMFQRIPTGMGRGVSFTRGLGSERTKPVLVMGQPGGNYRAFAIDSVDKATIRPIIDACIPNQVTVFTDGKPVYHYIEKEKKQSIKNGETEYRTLSQCNHSTKPKIWSDPISKANVNGVEAANGRIKAKTGRLHRGVSLEHLQEYLDEISWMVSNGPKDVTAAIEQLFDALPPLHSFSNKNAN